MSAEEDEDMIPEAEAVDEDVASAARGQDDDDSSTTTSDNMETKDQEEAPDALEMDTEAAPSQGEEEEEEEETREEPSKDQPEQQQPQEESAAAAAAAATSYSTRGRTAESADALDRLAREALGELAHAVHKEPSTTHRVESFLNDAISEEERRTRTRYIPDVDGMHMLRKQEIKSDIALAKTSFSSANVAGSVAASKAATKASKRQQQAMMDVDGDDGGVSVDDDRASDVVRLGTKTIEVGTVELVVPSTAFVAPPVTEGKGTKPSPREAEAVTAFNPPRPPESIGAKKKHRMLRWERRPADIEVDLNNYRRTVHRTREELKNAETERTRIVEVDNHLRKNFLYHLQCLSEEWTQLNKELAAVQTECVNAADLLTSRTRSRGTGKSSYAMRDVITVLRARGQEIETKGISLGTATSPDASENIAGVGGVGRTCLGDWDRNTRIESHAIASKWVLPGDEVETPYGRGTVVAVYGESALNAKEPPHEGIQFKGTGKKKEAADTASAMDVDSESPAKAKDAAGEDGESPDSSSDKSPDASASALKKAASKAETSFVAPRVAVQMPFGIGFYPVMAVKSYENPSVYNDARLAKRWKGLIETGVAMGSVLDVEGMADLSKMMEEGKETVAMETEDGAAEKDEASEKKLTRLVPFGAAMLPTASGRGANLFRTDPLELDKDIDTSMFDGSGVLGKKDNQGVTNEIRKHEDEYQELLILKARSLQLKNQLYRQRRVRLLNERTLAAAQERAMRMEAMVGEMRTDLKTLKRRLDEEATELGINEEEAEGILTAFYKTFDTKHSGEASPPKRQRRMSKMEDEDEDDEDRMEVEQIAVPTSVQ